ncbi:hypothetical protein Tco_1138946 [Tanacetum coccineum]
MSLAPSVEIYVARNRPSGAVSRTGNVSKTGIARNRAETPLLQALAFRVLDQPTSSSCSERNWSTYSSTEQYLNEKTKMWDVGGDEFGTMEDTGFLELAQLSFDEPKLESVFFSQNTN